MGLGASPETTEDLGTKDVATECEILTSSACYRIERFIEDNEALL